MNTVVTMMLQIIAIGGGAAALAYGLFVWLGKRWLEQHFAKSLERLRHEQAKEIEHVRHEINSLFSRVSKIHEREFEVLPAAWKKLHESYGRAFQACSALQQRSEPSKMSEGELTEFLANEKRLSEFRKEEIRRAVGRDRDSVYWEAISWVDLSDARKAHNEFHNYLVLNRIFMTDDLWDKFSKIDTSVNEALVAYVVGKESQERQMMREASQQLGGLDASVKEVERAVQKRLHYEEA